MLDIAFQVRTQFKVTSYASMASLFAIGICHFNIDRQMSLLVKALHFHNGTSLVGCDVPKVAAILILDDTRTISVGSKTPPINLTRITVCSIKVSTNCEQDSPPQFFFMFIQL